MGDLLVRLLNPSAEVAQPGPGADYWYESLPYQAGGPITPDTAMRVSTVNACTARYANTLAQTPWLTYRKRPDGRGKDRALDTDAYRLLHERPNRWHTPFQFKQLQGGLAILRGNAYARIVPNPDFGALGELHPLNPDYVTPERLPNRDRVYRVRDPQTGRVETLLADEMFHLTGLHYDGVRGIGAIEYARDSIAEALSSMIYSKRMLDSGVRPGGVLKHPGTLSAPARDNLTGSLAGFAGARNAGKPLLLEEGMTWEQIGMTNEAAQYVESRQMNTIELARAFNMPLIMIQEQSTTSSWGTGVEQQMIGFVAFTMLPVFVNFEERADTDLLGNAANLQTEFLATALMRGDTKSRYEVYRIAIELGIMSRNEVRSLENMNPYEGGDEYLTPLNMGAGAADGSAAGEPAPANATSAALLEAGADPRMVILGRELASRLARADIAEVGKAAKRYADDGAGWEQWLRGHYDVIAGELADRYSVDPAAARQYADAERDATIFRGADYAQESQGAKVAALQSLISGT